MNIRYLVVCSGFNCFNPDFPYECRSTTSDVAWSEGWAMSDDPLVSYDGQLAWLCPDCLVKYSVKGIKIYGISPLYRWKGNGRIYSAFLDSSGKLGVRFMWYDCRKIKISKREGII